jgi:hypothetical protein
MDSLNHYRQLIEKILAEYAAIPYAYGEIERQTAFDRAGIQISGGLKAHGVRCCMNVASNGNQHHGLSHPIRPPA